MAERKTFEKFFPTYDHDCFYTRWQDAEAGQSGFQEKKDTLGQQLTNIKQRDQALAQNAEIEERVLIWRDRVRADISRSPRSARINHYPTQFVSTTGSVIPETVALSDGSAEKQMASMHRSNKSQSLKDPASEQFEDGKGTA